MDGLVEEFYMGYDRHQQKFGISEREKKQKVQSSNKATSIKETVYIPCTYY